MSQFKSSQGGRTVSYSGEDQLFQAASRLLIRQGPPTLGRIIGFSWSINLNVNLIPKHPHRNSWNNV